MKNNTYSISDQLRFWKTLFYISYLLCVCLILTFLSPFSLQLQAMKHPPNAPQGDSHVLLEHFWVEAGELPRINPEEGKYVVTPTVRGHLSNLARAVLLRRHPILLQGPTSSGKTSLVEYLAQRTGHRFMRINNHEHTDLQEYLGTYVTDENGTSCYYAHGVEVLSLPDFRPLVR